MSKRAIKDELVSMLPFLRRYARVLVRGNTAEADDLVQETMLKAIRSIDRFREGAELRSWLTTIMINTLRSEHRKARSRQAYAATLPGEEPSAPPRQQDWVEAQTVLEALQMLPSEQREAIALMAFEDVRYAEAADMLGIKLGTFMSRLSRGRAALRKHLEGDSDLDKPPSPRLAAGGET
ncbi:MAG: sigma-70 family RNA polymerase sigma factor [Geminicoccaceae bacterium]